MKVPKFDDRNFLNFERRMTALLNIKGVGKYIQTEPVDEDERSEDGMATSYIILHLVSHAMDNIETYESTKQLWQQIKRRHLSGSLAVKARLHSQLAELKYQKGDEPVKFASEFTKIIN